MEESNEVKPVRRRRHSAEFKSQAIKACLHPGVSIAAVALHYRLNANLLRSWVAKHKESDAVVTTSMPQFVPLQLGLADGPVAMQDIVIEIRRGASTVTVRWPRAAAAECANWLHGWLR